MGVRPCSESDFTCVTLEMPLDHFDDVDERTIEGSFVVLTATDAGDELSFDRCGPSEEVVVSESGLYDWENDVFTMEVSIGDCDYIYERSGEDYTVDSGC